MIIYIHGTGPLIQYDEGQLIVSDLNPETMTRWRISRLDRLKAGLRFMASCFLR